MIFNIMREKREGMAMFKYIIKRLAIIVLTLVLIISANIFPNEPDARSPLANAERLSAPAK